MPESTTANIIIRLRDLTKRDLKTLTTSLSKLGKQTDQTKRKVQGLSRSVKGLSFGGLAKSALAFSGAMIGVTAGFTALAGAIRGVLTSGARFEKTMITVGAVSRSTDKQLKALTATARKMGEDTEWSANQAADALRFLSMAGFRAEDSIKALPGVLDLATAANVDLARSADIATNALTAMGLPVEELTRVNDVFINTMTRSNVNMEQMAESFKYAAPSAKAFGYDIEELSTMIGLLGNAGIQGSMAGTQLNFAFTKVSKTAKKLGLSMDTDLIGVLKELRKRGADADQVLEIFGQRAGRAALILMEQVVPAVEGGTSAYEDFVETQRVAAGETKRIADEMRNTVSGRFAELKSVIESAGIDIFNLYKESIKETLTELIKFIREKKHLLKYLPKITSALFALAKILAVGGLLNLGLKAITVLGPLVATAFKSITASASGSILALIGFNKQATLSGSVMKGLAANATFAAKAMRVLKAATGILMAAFIGWEIGSWLHDNFVEARFAGLALVDGLTKAWMGFKYFFSKLWLNIQKNYEDVLNFMKRTLGRFLGETAKLIIAAERTVGKSSGVATYLVRYQKNVNKSITSTEGLKKEIKALDDEYERNLALHQKGVDARIKEHLGLDKTGEKYLKNKMAMIKNRKERAKLLVQLKNQEKLSKLDLTPKIDPEFLQKSLESAIKRANALATTVVKELDKSYKDGLIGLDEYYKKREKILKEALDRELKLLRFQLSEKKRIAQEEIEAAEVGVKMAGDDPMKRARAEEKLEAAKRKAKLETMDLEDQIFVRKQKHEQDSLQLAYDREKDEKTLAENRLKITQDIEQRKIEATAQDTTIPEKHEQEIEAMKARHMEERNLLIDQHGTELQLEDLQNVQKLEKEKALAEQKKQIQQMQIDSVQGTLTDLGSVASDYYELSGNKSKEAFAAMKAISIAQTIIQTYQAAQAVFTSMSQLGPYGVALGAAGAAAAIAAGMLRVAKIRAQKPAYAEGGEVGGYSPSDTSDNILARLTAGEYVQPVKTVKYYGKEAMEAIRQRVIPKSVLQNFSIPSIPNVSGSFAQGGAVSRVGPKTGKEAQAGGQQPITINNIVDPAQMDQHLVSRPGQQSVMNVLSENQYRLKQLVFQQ